MKPFRTIAFALALGIATLLVAPAHALADLLKAGDPAPEFSTHAIDGDETVPVKLSDYRGKTVALYFYPKDFTPGCTTEACTFRDSYAKIHSAGIVLLGCSIDSADSHRKFIKQYSLPFPLLLDPDKKIATAYGVANGIPQYGLDGRVTYIIGGDGKILKVYPKVDPSANASQIISEYGSK
ncbi:MAG TPA: peroxiredoxin [Candidatus Binataceae bacterium]|nr:peroxiredoxin [Candidatus Binataceae bacterium]